MTQDVNLPKKLINILEENSLVIFLFHGVINRQSDRIRNYTKKHIDKDLFADCIKILSKIGNPISMDEVLFHLENKKPFSKKSFAITFDDGFENNLSVASSILHDFKVPATIYVTSDFIDNNHMSWIDRIELSVQQMTDKTIRVDHFKKEFSLDSDLNKINFLKEVRNFVKNDMNCNPNEFADELCYKLNKEIIRKSNNHLDLKMNWNQVKQMNDDDLFIIGGHGHTHQILSFLSNKELDIELDTSIKMLKEKAGISTVHYSYPEGLEHCYNYDVINALKRRGVKCCPTAIFGKNNEYSDSFELKRVMVG